MTLEDFRDQIYFHCICCSSCRWAYGSYDITEKNLLMTPLCPPGEKFGFGTYYAQGRYSIARGLMAGLLKWSDKLNNIVYSCTLCHGCDEMCYRITGHNPTDVEMELRRELVRRGIGPPTADKMMKESIEKNHNPFEESHEKRTQWIPSGISKKGDTVFFAGCNLSHKQESVIKSAIKILKASGDGFAMLGSDEWCCGFPIYQAGYVDELKDIAGHNLDAFKDAGAKRVVTTCAGCYQMLKLQYPKITSKKLPFEVLHITELLEEKIKEGKVKLKKPINKKITYHDPCDLCRGAKVYEPPRNVLKSIPGIELVEMKNNRRWSWCCGGGGGVKSNFPDLALWSAARRFEDMKEIGVKNLVTACPLCETNFNHAVMRERADIKVYDVVELIAESVGV